MLTGRVTAEREAVVPIDVHGPTARTATTEAAIDTGYNGYLTLPPRLIEDLELPFAGTARAALGDGKEVELDLFIASVQWEQERREVLVLSASGGILLGMAMLAGSRLVLEVEAGGAVTIEPLGAGASEA